MPKSKADVRARQAPIRQSLLDDPGSAVEVLRVHGGGSDGDVPCSGDLLLAALAACQETPLRMVAANMGIDLEELEVSVEGDWDQRGTLAMGKEFPIGITAIRVHTRVIPVESSFTLESV